MVRLKNDYDSPAPKFNSLAWAILKVTTEKSQLCSWLWDQVKR
jgi:hypothetical protein